MRRHAFQVSARQRVSLAWVAPTIPARIASYRHLYPSCHSQEKAQDQDLSYDATNGLHAAPVVASMFPWFLLEKLSGMLILAMNA